jgi:N-acetylglucosaminyl-diphospho-decaprenol L-rhamnosyltransferase
MRLAVDAVVVAYNSRRTLRACVEPLAGLADVSVTVVDNRSSDGSLEAIADLPVRRIEASRNGGFGFGCNLGAAAGSAPLLLFINPDARIDAGGLRRLVAALDADSSVAVVGPRTVGRDGRLVPTMRRYQRVGSVWATALFLHRLFPHAAWANEIVEEFEAYERPAYPEWISGACMMVRRRVFEAVGGFDERFFLYGEDMDLCARMRRAGHRIRYEPAAVICHEGGASAPRWSLYATLARSRIHFARQRSGRVSAALQQIGLGVGAVAHLLVTVGSAPRRRGHAAALRAVLAEARNRPSTAPARPAKAGAGPGRFSRR